MNPSQPSAGPPTPATGQSGEALERLRRAVAAAAHARNLELTNEAIRQSVARTLAETAALRAETRPILEMLREDVCGYVRALRAAGEPPERVLRLVKTAVEPELVAGSLAGRDPDWERVLLQDVVTWCIDEYFAA